jgi:hypothetical protein
MFMLSLSKLSPLSHKVAPDAATKQQPFPAPHAIAHTLLGLTVAMTGLFMTGCGGSSADNSAASSTAALGTDPAISAGDTNATIDRSTAFAAAAQDASNNTVTVKAKGTLAANVGPIMELRVDGKSYGRIEVRTTDYSDFVFQNVPSGNLVDVAYINDIVTNGQDRNLYIQSIKVGGTTLPSTNSNVVYDRSADEQSTIPGQAMMAWNGSLRFPTGNTASPAAAPTPTNTPTTSPTTPSAAPATGAAAPNLSNFTTVSGEFEELRVGEYRVINNTWGRREISRGWSQSVGAGPLNGDSSVSARLNWTWPSGSNEVKAFPEIAFGQTPTYASSTTTPNLPKQVNAIRSATYTWNSTSSVSGTGQLTSDIWLTSSGQPGNGNRTHEIMIPAVPYGGYGVNRNPNWYVGEVTVDGRDYTLHKADNFGAGWRFIVFQPKVYPVNAGTINFKAFLDVLKAKNLISGAEYLASIEFGVEPNVGSGVVNISSFKAAVN